jgi:tRNA(Ile)-lysidine synthase TilS/MesJ
MVASMDGTALGAKIDRALDRYPLLKREVVTVAFSGGKDSIALAYSLRQRGLRVRLRAVDMGYSATWGARIIRLAETLGLPLTIKPVRDLIDDSSFEAEARRDLTLRRSLLEKLAITPAPTTSPCTNCYNCKIISLVNGFQTFGESTLYFGHHATDMLGSFIKSALMYSDRWESGFEVFDRDRFRYHAIQLADALSARRRRTLCRLEHYLASGYASTSEPPVQRGNVHGRDYLILRPMIFATEADTATLTRTLPVRAESSGCGHTAAASTRTPREIVQLEALPLIEASTDGLKTLGWLQNLIIENLTPTGELTSDARQRRHEILGATYKGGRNELPDRL